MHIDQFPEDVQKAVYEICATAIKRAIQNGTFDQALDDGEKYLETNESEKAAL